MLGERVREDTNPGTGQERLRQAASDKCWAGRVREDTNPGTGQERLRQAASDKCWASGFVRTRTRAPGKNVFAKRLLISVGRAGS